MFVGLVGGKLCKSVGQGTNGTLASHYCGLCHDRGHNNETVRQSVGQGVGHFILAISKHPVVLFPSNKKHFTPKILLVLSKIIIKTKIPLSYFN